jgi:hypothetical protein
MKIIYQIKEKRSIELENLVCYCDCIDYHMDNSIITISFTKNEFLIFSTMAFQNFQLSIFATLNVIDI